jgi:hypothetical protein
MCGARARFSPLSGAEALIVGEGDRAVITVNSRSTFERQRFSIAHELGHWRYHRHQTLVCHSDEIENPAGARERERIADGYAASLLIPKSIYEATYDRRPLTWKFVATVAKDFRSSITAAAMRVVDLATTPALLIYLEGGAAAMVSPVSDRARLLSDRVPRRRVRCPGCTLRPVRGRGTEAGARWRVVRCSQSRSAPCSRRRPPNWKRRSRPRGRRTDLWAQVTSRL